MKRFICFATARPRTVLGVLFVFLAFLALIIGVLLPSYSHVAVWALFGLACIGALLSLGLLIRGSRPLPPTDQAEAHMAPSRVEALVALFRAFENRKTSRQPKEPCHLMEQTEEEYQKEQAEWLAGVKQKKENKKGKPPAAR